MICGLEGLLIGVGGGGVGVVFLYILLPIWEMEISESPNSFTAINFVIVLLPSLYPYSKNTEIGISHHVSYTFKQANKWTESVARFWMKNLYYWAGKVSSGAYH